MMSSLVFQNDEREKRFFQLKVKEITIKEASENNVADKIIKLDSSKILVQVIDVSDKMLYNEMKAEQSFQ